MNLVILKGKLKDDPILKYTSQGNASVYFTLIVPKLLSKSKKEEIKNKGGYTADFINIQVWGNLAEKCADSLRKGSNVLIQGVIQTNSFDKDGTKRYYTYVVATSVHFLDWDSRINYNKAPANTNNNKNVNNNVNNDSNTNNTTNKNVNNNTNNNSNAGSQLAFGNSSLYPVNDTNIPDTDDMGLEMDDDLDSLLSDFDEVDLDPSFFNSL